MKRTDQFWTNLGQGMWEVSTFKRIISDYICPRCKKKNVSADMLLYSRWSRKYCNGNYLHVQVCCYCAYDLLIQQDRSSVCGFGKSKCKDSACSFVDDQIVYYCFARQSTQKPGVLTKLKRLFYKLMGRKNAAMPKV